MAFAASVGLGIRQGTLRTSKSVKALQMRLCRSDLRLFSSLLLASTSSSRTLKHLQTPGSSRNLSLWGSNSTPSPAVTAEVPQATEETVCSQVTPSSITDESVSGSVVDSTPSADATGISSDVVNGVDLPVDTTLLSNVAEAVANHAPAALQYGDLASLGLAGWSPAGLIRWSLEVINVSTGMPWFWTIVAGTAFWKLVCVPFAIKGLQASARMQPHQAELVKLQQEIKKTAEKKDPIAIKKSTLQMQQFYKKHNINPLGGIVSLIQMPITLGLFFGIQKLCRVPLEQLHESGVSFLPDLTTGDPTYVLPLALCALINTQIQVGARDINTVERPDMGHVMNVFRILTVPGIFFMANFPSGLLISLMTTAILTTVQSVILRMPAIRRWLDIPIPHPSTYGRLPSLMSTFRRGKSWFQEDISNRVDKARQEALKRQQSARQPPRRF